MVVLGQNARPKAVDQVDLTEMRLFLVFQIAGGVGISLVLLTVLLSRKIDRHFTWINFCVTWVVYCISYTLLGISGQQTRPEPPAYSLCLIQASLTYAAPVLVAMSTFALVLQLWITITNALQPPKVPRFDRLRNTLLLVSPYVMWLGFVVAILLVGTLHPQTVGRSRHFTYCTISKGKPGPGAITAIVVAVILVVMVVIDSYVGAVLYRNWRTVRGSDKPGRIPLSLMLRVAIFSCVCIVGIGCAFVFLSSVSYFAGNMIVALMPLTAFLVFGTQQDIVTVWLFWRRS